MLIPGLRLHEQAASTRSRLGEHHVREGGLRLRGRACQGSGPPKRRSAVASCFAVAPRAKQSCGCMKALSLSTLRLRTQALGVTTESRASQAFPAARQDKPYQPACLHPLHVVHVRLTKLPARLQASSAVPRQGPALLCAGPLPEAQAAHSPPKRAACLHACERLAEPVDVWPGRSDARRQASEHSPEKA